ncbi:MAG: hypothetical protein VX966_01265 [Chloroflexota bacterium]|nr:hypothetical protein [Chloroflexota bacterium]
MRKTIKIHPWIVSFLMIAISTSMVACGPNLSEEDVSDEPEIESLTNEYESSSPANSLNLKDIYLNATDIPSGYELDEMDLLDNHIIASDWPDPTAALERYESWGRIEGYEVEFSKEVYSNTESVALFTDITMACSVYGDDAGAIEDFMFQQTDGEFAYKYEIDSLEGSNYFYESSTDVVVGDDSFSGQTTYTDKLDGKNLKISRIQVVFRKAYVVCAAALTSFGGEAPKYADLEFVAENQDKLIISALGD